MKILILGYSSIVQKRVIPALVMVPDVSCIDVASRRASGKVCLPDHLKGTVYDDYELALSKSDAEIAYISTLNPLHAPLAGQALLKGFHVIVDKPAVVSLAEAERLASLSKQQKRILAEATVYAYHPQIPLMQEAFSAAGAEPTRISAAFSFPPRSASDYRYHKALGGGALLDLGPYAMTPGRLFFNEEPEQIFCRLNNFTGDGQVEISFSLLAIYSRGRSLVGHFGFDTEYRNLLNIFGPGVSIECERVFSITPDLKNPLLIKEKNLARTLLAPPADCFVLFFNQVFKAIKDGNYENYLKDLLSDALVMEKLRLAAGISLPNMFVERRMS